MSGVAKTIDKTEEDARRKNREAVDSPSILSAGRAMAGGRGGIGIAGELKRKYGQRHDISTEEGYYAGKIAHETEEERKKAEGEQRQAESEAAARTAAAEAAALERGHASQRAALKRKGRRASILTSPQGVSDPLGIPGV